MMDNIEMNSPKPYFVRAIYEWITDNGCTPYLQVWVNEHTRVPKQFVQDNQIVLNIGMNACQNLLIDNEWISFQARFGGVVHDVLIPMGHVLSLYPRETGVQLAHFEVEEYQAPATSQENQTIDGTEEKPVKKGLRLVK